MKTKEFIEKVNKLGYKVKKVELGTKVYAEIESCTVALVNEDFNNMVDLSYLSDMSDELFDLIVAYAKTPLEERKPAKRYMVKLFPHSEGYLNVHYRYSNVVINEYTIGGSTELGSFRTKFTEDEIEELKKKPDLAIDWNKVKLEEVK